MISSWQYSREQLNISLDLSQSLLLWGILHTQCYERSTYHFQCCTNCTIYVYLMSFLWIIHLDFSSSILSIPVLCSFLGHKKSLDRVGSQIVHKKKNYNFSNCCQILVQETFIQHHLGEALCNLAACSPLKIDGALPPACLCIPETVGRPRLRTERDTRNRKKKQPPQYSC